MVEERDLAAEYAEDEKFTLFIGITLSVFGLVPMLIFYIVVYSGVSAEHRTIIQNDHFPYFIAWVATAGLNLILFGPWVVAWVILFFFS